MMQTGKNTEKNSFFISLNTPRWQPLSKTKIKTIEHGHICGTLIIFCISNINHSLTCPKTFGQGPKRLKILKTTPPRQPWSKNKIKTVGHGNICDNYFILCSLDISHPLTCPKTQGKGLKRLAILKMIIFHNYEHFPVNPTHKIKNQLGTQLHVKLLVFCAILM